VRDAIGLGVAVAVFVGGCAVRVINGCAAACSAPIGCEAASGAPHALSMIKIARLMMTRLMRAIILHQDSSGGAVESRNSEGRRALL
jgi:hypothetical protein